MCNKAFERNNEADDVMVKCQENPLSTKFDLSIIDDKNVRKNRSSKVAPKKCF